MYIYLIMLIISILFIYLSEKTEKKCLKILFSILAVLPFIIVSIIRYDVGTDYMYRYVPDYSEMVNGNDVENLEIGFKLIMKLCILITKDPQILFVITSSILICLIMKVIFEKSKDKALSVGIFFLGGFFFQSLNIMRQYLAIAIVFFSYKYIFTKKYWLFLLGMVIAFFIHSSSIVCILFLLLKDKEILNLKNLVIIILVIAILGTPLINVFKQITENTRFSVYLESSYDRGEMRKLTIISQFILYLFIYGLYIVKKHNKKTDIEDKFFINIQGMNLICIVLSSKFYLFFRIAYYFMIFLIISIPYFIRTTNTKEIIEFYKNKLDKYIIKFFKKEIKINDKIMQNMTNILCIFIIVFFGIIIFYTNVLHNDEEVLPYKTIFYQDRNG